MLGNAGQTQYDLGFQLFGIPVRIHPGFWLIAALVFWKPAGGEPLLVLIGILCVLFSILVHELGHAITFRRYGYNGEIVLYWMGGYATGGALSTWKEVIVSAAGPGAGFVVAGIVFYFLKTTPQEVQLENYAVYWTLRRLWFVNFWWGIMNLTPCLPLDGGRIAQALIHRYSPVRAAIKVLKVSIVSSGAIALWAASRGDQFLMIFFGIMCAQHVMALNQRNQFR